MVNSNRYVSHSRLERGRSYQTIRDVHDNFNNLDDISEKVSVSLPEKKSVSIDYVAWTIGILSLSLFVPLMVGADFHLENTQIEISARSVECRSFAIASLSVSLSLLIDLLLDVIFTENAGYLYLRSYSILALTAYSLAYLVASHYDNFGEIEVVFGAVQLFGEVSTAIWFLHSLDTLKCWSKLSIYSIIWSFYLQYLTWYLNYIYFYGDTKAVLYTISLSFFYFAAAIIIGQCVYWFYLLHKELKSNKSDKTSLPVNIHYSNVIIAVVILFGLLKLILKPVVTDLADVHDDYAIISSIDYADGNLLLRTGFTFFLCLLPGRIFKREAAERNYDSEMKSTFVSFMNHEMRTPLNIVRMFITISSLISYSPNHRHRSIFARQADSEQVQHRDSA